MISLTFPDGAKRDYAEGTSGADIAVPERTPAIPARIERASAERPNCTWSLGGSPPLGASSPLQPVEAATGLPPRTRSSS